MKLSQNNSVELHIPTISFLGIWLDYSCTLYQRVGDQTIEISKLLFNTFDRPIFLMLNESKDTLYILYDFDIRVELIAFDIDSIITKEIPKELEKIIISSKWNVRRGKESEVNNMKNHIIKAGARDLQKNSNPVLDFGLYKYYLNKNKLLDLMKRIKL
jgi:hypothetical protein